MSNMSMQPSSENTPQANNAPAVLPSLNAEAAYGPVYPELYMKLRPHIDMACDILNTYGPVMPTQRQLEQVSDGVLEEFCALYPEMVDYMHRDDPQGDPPSFFGMPGGRPGRFRRRGIGRDLISTLLLAELFNRGFFFF